MNKIVTLSLLLGFSSMTLMAQTNPEHVIPTQKNLSEEFTHSLYDKSDYIFTGDELKTIGMPVGGIAAGQLYVRGDGSLANWWIANNGYNTGYGIAHLLNFATAQGDWKVCYQTFEPFSYVDQYFEITYKQDGEEVTRRLDKSGFDAIEFRGEYPVAMIDYKDSEDIAPVDVSMRIFSPFVPGELRKSATPATIIKFTVTNNSKRAQEITFGGVLQNMVMRDLMQSATGSSRNVTFSEDGRVGVTFDFVPDDKSLLSH
ncbi:MAG: GH116 family glycosyl-hydrolase, partial [Rikenellaceae bacterium]